ncbi:hypothetical protein EAI30_06500 [Romboutsia ilealis]|nr:hypothetical protein [Romboutsia ilealis]
MYITKLDNKIAKCIVLRKIDQDNCKIKRLIIGIIKDANIIGYKYMLLSILPFLKSDILLCLLNSQVNTI